MSMHNASLHPTFWEHLCIFQFGVIMNRAYEHSSTCPLVLMPMPFSWVSPQEWNCFIVAYTIHMFCFSRRPWWLSKFPIRGSDKPRVALPSEIRWAGASSSHLLQPEISPQSPSSCFTHCRYFLDSCFWVFFLLHLWPKKQHKWI